MKLKIGILSLAAATAAITGCESAANTNVSTNARNMNSNTAVVVNANTNTVTTTNTNRWSNTNVNRADYDKDRADYEKDKGSSTIGQGANDSWLWFKTRSSLMTSADLRESTIDVDAVNDVITLKGTVENAAQKTKAEQVAKAIEGVKSVKNELKVAANDSMTNTGSGSSSGNSRTNTNNR